MTDMLQFLAGVLTTLGTLLVIGYFMESSATSWTGASGG